MKETKTITELTLALRQFASERDWEQFHSPKNLVMALSVEVSELMEHFQWLTEGQSRSLTEENKEEIKDEIGDSLIYLVRLADQLEINLGDAAWSKLAKNREKYPVSLSKGRSTKYTDFPTNEEK